jgi:hypothetical protein
VTSKDEEKVEHNGDDKSNKKKEEEEEEEAKGKIIVRNEFEFNAMSMSMICVYRNIYVCIYCSTPIRQSQI